MKENIYTSLICKDFCNYYKPGKEEEICGGYFYLRNFVTPLELTSLIKIFKIRKEEVVERNFSSLCEKCEFRVDGCDFFVSKSDIPCGGYVILSRLYRFINLL